LEPKEEQGEVGTLRVKILSNLLERWKNLSFI